MQVDCKYKEICAGCQYLDHPLKVQHQLKMEHLKQLLQKAQIPFNDPIRLESPAPAGLRDRADLVWDHGALGLYEKNTKRILDIEVCQQYSPELKEWHHEVRKIQWPISKGSLRLRVGPQKQKGIWLDFANADIKMLLTERSLLEDLLGKSVVEIGQRHKVLTLVNGELKLKDPTPLVWSQSFIEGHAVDLFSTIGTFTQPGIIANRALTKVIEEWLNEIKAKHILEFGSGIGNLSFPALAKSRRVTACEIDRQALAGFEKSLEKLSLEPGFENIRERISIQQGDFQNRNPQKFGDYDTILVNPPRSGLKNFLKPLIEETAKPAHFLYMSCFPETFIEDGKRLQEAGYELEKLTIVDQFPQTHHYEVLSLWKLKKQA